MGLMMTGSRTLVPAGPRAGYQPVADEVSVFDLEVAGVLPPELDGTLLRIGPNPERDPGTGELYAVAYQPGRPHVQYLTVDVAGRVRRCEPIELGHTPMMHAFSLTDRHAILYDLPVVYSPGAAAAGSRMPYGW